MGPPCKGLGCFQEPSWASRLTPQQGSGHARVQDRLVTEVCQHLCESTYQVHLDLVLLLCDNGEDGGVEH